MVSSVLEQYRISDILEWYEKKQLELNPDFQRGKVWTAPARTFFIDSVLRGLPIPKIFVRTRVDLTTKRSYREVVDGQQRLQSIMDFAADQFTLGKRASEFSGLTYSDLTDELQEAFLAYPLSVDQLINASDDDVLEVFARINSYNVALNPAELRHATYQGEFKWVVHRNATKWNVLWDDLQVVRTRQRVRMMHDALMAEMFGVVIQGVTDGGAAKIDALYEDIDDSFPESGRPHLGRVNAALKLIVAEFSDVIRDTPLANAPHFLMLFAAVAHAQRAIPAGDMGDTMPRKRPTALRDTSLAAENLEVLSAVIAADKAPRNFSRFWRASSGTTQRIASRRVRMPVFYKALLPKPLVSESK
jgi:hypothetical protein